MYIYIIYSTGGAGEVLGYGPVAVGPVRFYPQWKYLPATAGDIHPGQERHCLDACLDAMRSVHVMHAMREAALNLYFSFACLFGSGGAGGRGGAARKRHTRPTL